MSEEAKELQKKLFNKKENGVDFMSEEELKACDEFCEGYKKFLFENKTEREFAKSALALAKEHGFVEFDKFGKPLKAGDKVYYFNRGKAIILAVKGKRPVCDGVRISAAHIDSPRLDLKQCPVYEDGSLGFFKTHYYGGIKKYQWTAIPLSLHGRICKNDGTHIDVKVGEDPADPKISIFDLMPEMSAPEVSQKLNEAVRSGKYDAIIVNFANCDMVGHTGIIPAAVKAVETVDACVGSLAEAVIEMNGNLFITADHGNADKMLDENGEPFTAHTTNPVPFVAVNCGDGVELRDGGKLCDIAPTMLQMLGLDKPAEMTGTSLIK